MARPSSQLVALGFGRVLQFLASALVGKECGQLVVCGLGGILAGLQPLPIHCAASWWILPTANETDQSQLADIAYWSVGEIGTLEIGLGAHVIPRSPVGVVAPVGGSSQTVGGLRGEERRNKSFGVALPQTFCMGKRFMGLYVT